MSVEKILQDYKEALILVLKQADTKFVKKLKEDGIVSSKNYGEFCSLDHRNLDSRLRARYLVKLIYEYLRHSGSVLVLLQFSRVLSQFEYSANLGLFLEIELSNCGASGMGQQPLSDDIILQDNYVPILTELLVDCSHKWEEMGIALQLCRSVIEACREGVSNPVRLHNILTNYHGKLDGIKNALESPLVQMPSLALNLKERLRDKIILKMPILRKPQSSFISEPDSQPSRTKVRDGKSTLLGVQVPPSCSASYQWKKDGMNLCDNLKYSGIDCEILLIRAVCQGFQGKFSCTMKYDNVEQNKEVYLAIIYSPFKECLLEKYSLEKEVPSDSWPPVSTSTYIDLALIHNKTINREYDYSVRGDIDDILKEKEKMEYKNLFCKYEPRALVLIEGRPGSGKTTLAQKLARDWAIGPNILKGAKLVFLVSLRILNYSKQDESIADILKPFYNKKHLKEVTKMLNTSYGKGACFIIDGLDEYRNHSSVITELIHKVNLHNAMIIVASRPVGTAQLRDTCKIKITKRIEVLGFSKDRISTYLNKYNFKPNSEVSKLEAYLHSHLNVLHMCYLPVHAAMICHIFDQCKEIPNTETKIYDLFTLLTIQRKLKRDGRRHEGRRQNMVDSLQVMDGDMKQTFFNICKLAFEMTTSSKQTIHQDETEIRLSDGSGCDVHSLGLVTVDSTAKMFNYEDLFSFLHLTFQEFLAAYFISELNESEQLKVIEKYISNKEMLMVWKFYCGIEKSDNPRKKQLELIMRSKSMSDMHRIQCAFESQQQSVCAFFFVNSSDVLNFEEYTFSPTDFNAINFVFSNSSCPINLVLDNCLLDRNGIIYNTDNLRDIKSLRFSTKHGKEQFELLNLLLMKLNCLEILDLTSQELNVENITTIAKNVDLHNLKNLMITMPSFPSKFDSAELLKMLCFNSASLKQVQCYFGTFKYEEHNKSLSDLLIAFKCEIVPLGDISHDILSNIDVDLSRVPKFLSLSSLILTNCNIHDTGVHYLVKAGTKFETLRLDVNHISNYGARVLSNHFMSICTGLQHLSLSCNHVGDEGAMALASALVANPSLIELDLQCNAIGDEGVIAIAKALKDFPSKLQLLLFNVSVTPAGAAEVLEYRRTAQIQEDKPKCAWNIVFKEDQGAVNQAYQCFKYLHTLNFSRPKNRSLKYMQLSISLLANGLKFCKNLKKLILNHCGINDMGMEELTNGLNYCSLEVFDLHDNLIGGHGAAAIARWLRCGDELLSEEIFTSFRIETRSFLLDTLNKKIQPKQECNWTFISLLIVDLGNNHIGSEGAAALAYGLKRCSKLQSLNFIKNDINGDGVKALAIVLEKCHTLEVLHLDYNRFCVPLKGCVNLQTLSLEHNKISNMEAKYLIQELMCCSNLKSLNLSKNNICSIGGDALGQALKCWKQLQELNIGNNLISWCNIKKLAEGLKCCTQLKTLNIQNNEMYDQETLNLLKGLSNCTQLQTLELDGNELNDSAVTMLVELLRNLSNIQTLSLSGTSINDHRATVLVEGLKYCTTLRSLNICKNQIQDLNSLIGKLQYCTIITDDGNFDPVVSEVEG